MKTFIVKSESFIEQELVDAKEILDYDGDLILRQANQLAQEGYITVETYLEHRIMLAILAVIEREKDLEHWYRIRLSTLAIWSNSDTKATKTALKRIEKSLDSRCLCIISENSKKRINIPWFTGLSVDEENSFVYVRLHKDLSKYTIDLKEKYMEEFLSVMLGYKRHASMILHNFFCAHLNYSSSRMSSMQMEAYQKEIKIPVSLLRELVPNGVLAYKNTNTFLTKIVNPALLEINNRGYFLVSAPEDDKDAQKLNRGLYRLGKSGKRIQSITLMLMAGRQNTRLEKQRIIDSKKEQVEAEEEKTATQLLTTLLENLSEEKIKEVLAKVAK